MEKIRNQKRIAIRVSEDMRRDIYYYADKRGESIQEFILEAINLMIRHEHEDYDLPRAEIQRLNQLIETITVLSQNQANLERITVAGFGSLLGLARGENYLVNESDQILGEIK